MSHSQSIFTVAKVVKAYRTLPDGSRDFTIASQAPDGSLHTISNLEGHKTDLERLAEDAKADLNYAAFQILGNKVYYVPVENLHGIIKKMEKDSNTFIGNTLQSEQSEGINQIKNMLPIVKGMSYDGKNTAFVLF